ncbi:MAG: hypothetical protein ACHQ5A_00225 [Opitutales bacterium]
MMPLPGHFLSPTPSDQPADHRSLPRTLGWILLLAAPALIYLAVLSSLAVNVPTGDDFFAIFGFLDRWQDPARGSHGNLDLLFGQFYSHRIPFTRLAVLGLTALEGHCDLRLLLVLAWTGWGLLLGSLVWSRWSTREGLLWLLPVSLLLMQPQGHTNLLVATGSPGHAWTILLAYWTCRLAWSPLLRQQGWVWLCATAAAFCTSNGLLLFPLVALGKFFRRQWWHGLGWLAGGTVVWGWYLRGYSTAGQPFVISNFSVWRFVTHAAVMAGSLVDFGTIKAGIVQTVGLILLLTAMLAWWREWRDSRGRGDGTFLLFLLLSVAMIAYARSGWTADYMLQDRYRPYGLMLVTMLYLQLMGGVSPARRTMLQAAAIPLALGFNFISYAQMDSSLLFAHRWAEATAMNLSLDRLLPLPSAPDQSVASGEILRKATRRGLFRPPQLLRSNDVTMIRTLPSIPPSGPVLSWQCVENPDLFGCYLEPAGEAMPSVAPDFGVLFQGENPLILPVLFQRARFAEILPRRSFLSDRYGFVLPGSAYAPGRHVLYAIKRTAAGKLIPLWSAFVTCP